MCVRIARKTTKAKGDEKNTDYKTKDYKMLVAAGKVS